MNSYDIVTDVTIDLPATLVENLGIHVIPMEFTLGDKTYMHYVDEREISNEDFYQELKKGTSSVTSQIMPIAYKEFFEPLLEKGKDILFISLSSGLSGSYHASKLAAAELMERYPDRKIHSVDSVCASVGEGLLVYLAAQEAKKGICFDEIVRFAEEMKYKCCHWFTVEDLYQLKRGGRVNTLEAVLGSALQIHPILSTDREGKLKVVSKVRGMKKAMDYLIARLQKDGTSIDLQTVFIAHGNAPDYAEKLAKEIRELNLVKEIIITKVGPVIGTHTGTGMLALVFVGENYKD